MTADGQRGDGERGASVNERHGAQRVAPSGTSRYRAGTPAGRGHRSRLRVTTCPVWMGFGVDVRLVEVATGAGAFTSWVTTAEVLAANVALPL